MLELQAKESSEQSDLSSQKKIPTRYEMGYFRHGIFLAIVVGKELLYFFHFRKAQLEALRSGKEYDVLVIGGGVTGAGVALDSQLRGTYDTTE